MWEKHLAALAGVDVAAVCGLLREEERASLAGMLMLVHAQPTGRARPRSTLEESFRRHESLVKEMAPPAAAKRVPGA